MSSYILFLILGLGSGATYAILGQGLVLKYRSAGVVDFAHGAVAMFIAYVFVNLRSFGELELPVVLIPHQISLNGGAGLNTALAIVISLAYAAVFGLVLYVLIYRPLRGASPLTRVCASVGVMLGLQAIAVLNYSTEPVATNPIFPSSPLSVSGVTFPEDRLFFTGVVVVISVALALTYRFSRFGLATRAGAENDRGAALTGISANRVAGQNWVIATVILPSKLSLADSNFRTVNIKDRSGVPRLGRLDGKRALISGTGGGIGRAAALLFAREGAHVVGCDLDPRTSGETVDLVRTGGGRMDAVAPVDLATEEGARRWVREAVDLAGGVVG